MIDNVIKYDGKTFDVVMDENITPAEHCDYCDFKNLCKKYLEKEDWFPCGATFHANKVYLKERK